jgi:hypothetical protein
MKNSLAILKLISQSEDNIKKNELIDQNSVFDTIRNKITNK